MPRTAARYGWRPDLPDHRDFLAPPPPSALPASVDLRRSDPPIVDQGRLGSCTGNAIAGAFGHALIREKLPFAPLSRLFIYYNERAMEGDVSQDAGAQIRDGVKSVATLGVCPESECPYVVSHFANTPTAKAYTDALASRATKYTRQSIASLRAALAAGQPVVFGFTVYESFENDLTLAHTGVMPMPKPHEGVVGGHAVLAVGYTPTALIVRNSWGTSWGDHGYFYMPWAYATSKLVSDLWTLDIVA